MKDGRPRLSKSYSEAVNFCDGILRFFRNLDYPPVSDKDIETLWPYSSAAVQSGMQQFYTKFYRDETPRIFLIGINPGRFGAGVTGICFTDPLRLKQDCGIEHSIPGRMELSSDFIYRMISAFGGVHAFYSRFYLTSLCTVGFTRDGKNLNYYDVSGLPEKLDDWMARKMKEQIQAGGQRGLAFSMGMGKNYKYLQDFNARHGFFDRIEALPHPRWVMQYRRKKLDEFIQTYVDMLTRACS